METIRKPDYKVSYDMINQTTTVSVGSGDAGGSFTVSKSDPANALAVATHEYNFNEHGLTVKVHVHAVTASDAETFRHLEEVDITLDDKPYFHKNWTISVPRQYN